LFALEQYEEAIQALNELPHQSYRSRLYHCAVLAAQGRETEAKKVMKQALAINPEISASAFIQKESWRDHAKRQRIRRDLINAGLPK